MDLQQGTHAEMDESLRIHGAAMIRDNTHVFFFSFGGDGRIHVCGAEYSVSFNRTTNFCEFVLKKEMSDKVNIKTGTVLLMHDI